MSNKTFTLILLLVATLVWSNNFLKVTRGFAPMVSHSQSI